MGRQCSLNKLKIKSRFYKMKTIFRLEGDTQSKQIIPNPKIETYECLLYRHEYFTGKYTTCKMHTKPHPGHEWHVFHILTSEDIDDFTDIKFVSKILLQQSGC